MKSKSQKAKKKARERERKVNINRESEINLLKHVNLSFEAGWFPDETRLARMVYTFKERQTGKTSVIRNIALHLLSMQKYTVYYVSDYPMSGDMFATDCLNPDNRESYCGRLDGGKVFVLWDDVNKDAYNRISQYFPKSNHVAFLRK